MTRKIYGIGEVVFDIIFKNNIPFDSCPGGSVLNALVSLSRQELNTSLITDCVEDKVGNIILDFLKENKVNTKYIQWYNTGRSRLALAFLNEKNEAGYLFYKMQSESSLTLSYPETNETDIILFGSYYGIKPEIRKGLKVFLESASENKSVIVYDPNFRQAHLPILEQVRNSIYENFRISDIVKGSEEDFFYIFNTGDYDEIYKRFKDAGGRNLIITCAEKNIQFYNNNVHLSIPVPFVEPVSTIGAGDTFSAAIVYELILLKLFKKDIDKISVQKWNEILSFSVNCSVAVCKSKENYLPVGFFRNQSL